MTFRSILLSIFIPTAFVSSAGIADEYRLMWEQNLIQEQAVKEVGRAWRNYDAIKFDGKSQWTSTCPWDSAPIPPSQPGYNSEVQSMVQLGNRNIEPREVKYRTRPGVGQQKETLVYSAALLRADEVQQTFPNKIGMLQFRVQGTVDRCPNGYGSGMSWTPNLVRRFISLTVRCNNADEFVSIDSGLVTHAPGIWYGQADVWRDSAKIDWPATENRPFKEIIQIPIDTTSCDSEMFVTARVTQEERLTLDDFHVWAWSL